MWEEEYCNLKIPPIRIEVWLLDSGPKAHKHEGESGEGGGRQVRVAPRCCGSGPVRHVRHCSPSPSPHSRPWQPAFSCLSVDYLRCVASHSFHGQLSSAQLTCICICECEYLLVYVCVCVSLSTICGEQRRRRVRQGRGEARRGVEIKTKEFCGLLLLLLL